MEILSAQSSRSKLIEQSDFGTSDNTECNREKIVKFRIIYQFKNKNTKPLNPNWILQLSVLNYKLINYSKFDTFFLDYSHCGKWY